MFDCVHCCCEEEGGCPNCGLNNLNNNNNSQATKQLDMQVLFTSFYSNSPGNLGFIYTLGKKRGNIVLFWVAVRVVMCLHIFTNYFVSEGG